MESGRRHRFSRRFWAWAGAVSIRTKVLGIVLALVIMLGMGVTIQVRAALLSTLTERLQAQGISIARDVAARSTDLILVNDLYALHQLALETQANNADVRYVFVLDTEGRILAHTFGEGFPMDLLDANTVGPEEHHRGVWLRTDEGLIWDVAVPVFEGQAGVVRVGLSERGMRQTMRAITSQMLLTTGLVSAVGTAAAGLLTWILTRPILSLVDAAKAVERGDLTRRVERWADDEIGDLAEAFNAMTESLERAAQERAERDELRARYVSGVIAAQEEERKRIARELHDGTSQTLTSLLVGLRTLEGTCIGEESRQQLEDLRRVAVQTLEEVHDLALRLRPSVLDDLGLPAALGRHISEYNQRHSVKADLVVHGLGEERLPAPVETALYRIVQEALTNVVRHARARHASVLLEKRDGCLRVVVEDDGQGFDVSTVGRDSRHLGLYGIRERAELLGGSVKIESEPGRGTSVFVEIPLDESPSGNGAETERERAPEKGGAA